MAYCYVWEYIVRPEHAREFERTYGEDGEWVQLFRRATGHVRTELLRDRALPDRYLTIDHWESEAAWQAFRAAFDGEFRALDARCATWTTRETEIGRFAPVAG